MASVTRVGAPSMTAPRTNAQRPAAPPSTAATACPSGISRLCAEGPHPRSGRRSAMVAASRGRGSEAASKESPAPTLAAASSSSGSGREAATQEGPAPAEPAADQAAPLLGRIASRATALWVAVAVLPKAYVAAALGVIAGGAAAGGLGLAAHLAALLLLVPWLGKKYSEWNASRLTRLQELERCRKRRAAAQQAPTPVLRQLRAKLCQWMRAATQQAPTPVDQELFAELRLEMAERRTQYQQLGMRLGKYGRIFRLVLIATIALISAAQLIEAASPILPFLRCFTNTVRIPVFGWTFKIVSLMTEWPLATFGAVYLQPIVTEFFDFLEARDKFFTAAAQRRAAHPVRPRRKP